jgi:hypothetical protein
MPSQRVILGIGLAVLLMISAASIGLDVKSRSAATEAGHGAVPTGRTIILRAVEAQGVVKHGINASST